MPHADEQAEQRRANQSAKEPGQAGEVAQDRCGCQVHEEESQDANETADGMELWTANAQGAPTMKGTATW